VAMTTPSDAATPVVEESPQGASQSDLTGRALQLRIRQQEILSELGVLALQGTTLKDLLDQTVRYTAEGLEAEFCKVLEYLPQQKEFVVRAGIGWHEGVVGSARFGADLESPAGFALRTGKPVISNHLENEERFRTPKLLGDHGIRRAMNVILQGEGAPFGVLEVDAVSEGAFAESDVPFLQGAANILGMAIERERREQRLKAAVERQQVLLKEINHRVKNSLQIVSALLTLQMGDGTDPALQQRLMDASSRVSAIARAHERLYKNDDIGVIELGGYLRDVCSDLNLSVSGHAVEVVAEDGIRVATDLAIPLVLIANELITNAVKYAYPARTEGKVHVVLARKGEGHIVLTVADDGVGMPATFDPKAGKSLGMRIVRAFAVQLGAEFSVGVRNPGAQFTLLVPLEPPA
jgi:two-component sensor histidine kinase